MATKLSLTKIGFQLIISLFFFIISFFIFADIDEITKVYYGDPELIEEEGIISDIDIFSSYKRGLPRIDITLEDSETIYDYSWGSPRYYHIKNTLREGMWVAITHSPSYENEILGIRTEVGDLVTYEEVRAGDKEAPFISFFTGLVLLLIALSAFPFPGKWKFISSKHTPFSHYEPKTEPTLKERIGNLVIFSGGALLFFLFGAMLLYNSIPQPEGTLHPIWYWFFVILGSVCVLFGVVGFPAILYRFFKKEL